ncbi:hypothetical protein [Alishewanella sp. SMS8]|uniref:hypothetical protein n=1 Tax=Alishewanella sp. SMS8 TaxID=2994676 RepID=UPI002742802C|nr:hypothetical protein [Alishewanella sp. SMS8]MDP5459573.1 hypothetical protein [Alishewanella sp. SMS8]
MQYVGDELERLALGQGDETNSDLLGRSAFNRYYYASFLITRETIKSMQISPKFVKHAEIPIILQEGLKKKAKPRLDKLVREGLMDKGTYSRLLTDLNVVGNELAELLQHANDARVLADYEPEIKTERDGSVIKLKDYKLTTAKVWPSKARQLCGRLLRIWRDIGLA